MAKPEARAKKKSKKPVSIIGQLGTGNLLNKTKKFNLNNKEYTLRVYNNENNDGILELNGRKFSGTMAGVRARIFSAESEGRLGAPFITLEMGYKVPVFGKKSKSVTIRDKKLIDNLPKLMRLKRGESLEIGGNKLERI